MSENGVQCEARNAEFRFSPIPLGSKTGDKMAAGKTNHRLVRGFVPLDGGVGFGAKVFTGKERVENSDSVEVKSILVFSEVLEKLGEFFGGDEAP